MYTHTPAVCYPLCPQWLPLPYAYGKASSTSTMNDPSSLDFSKNIPSPQKQTSDRLQNFPRNSGFIRPPALRTFPYAFVNFSFLKIELECHAIHSHWEKSEGQKSKKKLKNHIWSQEPEETTVNIFPYLLSLSVLICTFKNKKHCSEHLLDSGARSPGWNFSQLLAICVTLSKLLNFSGLWFPHLSKRRK